MRSFWFDPYLWVHLAGVAVLPIALELCLFGLAVGDPFLPAVLEVGLVAIVGIAPILWMQWQKPFYIYSLLGVALKFEKLTTTQRRLLQRFKSTQIRVASAGVAIGLAIVLWQLYRIAPIAIEAADFLPQYRGLGLLIAAIGFFLSNLFLQIPLSVLLAMLTSEANLGAIEPYAIEQIPQAFTVLGLRLNQILPQVVLSEPVQSEPVQSEPVQSEPVTIASSQPEPESAAPDTPTASVEIAVSADAVSSKLEADSQKALAEAITGLEAIEVDVAITPLETVTSIEPVISEPVATDAKADVKEDEIASG